MKLVKNTAIITTTLLLSACSQQMAQLNDLFRPSTSGTAVRVVKGTPNVYETQKKNTHTVRSSAKQTVTTRRINTTECQDSDDWYLDGYRVGKSFTAQKTQMLQNRMNFCQLSHLPTNFKRHWERGFTVGAKNIAPKAHAQHSVKAKKAKRT